MLFKYKLLYICYILMVKLCILIYILAWLWALCRMQFWWRLHSVVIHSKEFMWPDSKATSLIGQSQWNTTETRVINVKGMLHQNCKTKIDNHPNMYIHCVIKYLMVFLIFILKFKSFISFVLFMCQINMLVLMD